jgi:hypothetical protein
MRDSKLPEEELSDVKCFNSSEEIRTNYIEISNQIRELLKLQDPFLIKALIINNYNAFIEYIFKKYVNRVGLGIISINTENKYRMRFSKLFLDLKKFFIINKGYIMIIKNLTKVANRLDSLGLTKEADYLDSIIRKLAAEGDQGISKALKRESDLFFESADPTRWVDTNMPMEKVDNYFNRRFHPENFQPIKSVNSYLDMENLKDLKDKKDFFSFLAGKIDRAKYLAEPEDISFLGPPKIPTREEISSGFLMDRDFMRLHDKYGQPIIDALWRYIDEASELFKEKISGDPNKRFQAFEDLRELKRKITTLGNS